MTPRQPKKAKVPLIEAPAKTEKNWKSKQRKIKFARLIASGMNQTEAYKTVNPEVTPRSATSLAVRLMKDDTVQARLAMFRRRLEMEGLGNSAVIKHLKKGLNEAQVEGKHGDYLDRLISLNGLVEEKSAPAAMNAPQAPLLQFSLMVQSKGVVGLNGKAELP